MHMEDQTQANEFGVNLQVKVVFDHFKLNNMITTQFTDCRVVVDAKISVFT